ncbi:hypothetical protein K1X76_11655 [bacterium]|nr:hypothetical protein [bacterium]
MLSFLAKMLHTAVLFIKPKMLVMYALSYFSYWVMTNEELIMSVQRFFNLVSGNTMVLEGEKFKPFIGQYKLTEIKFEDTESIVALNIYPDEIKTFQIKNYGEGPSKLRAGVMLSPESSLHISSNNVCTFKWQIDVPQEDLDSSQLTVESTMMSGKQKVFGCLNDDKSAKLPNILTKLNNTTYKKIGDYLYFTSSRLNITETFIFKKEAAFAQH